MSAMNSGKWAKRIFCLCCLEFLLSSHGRLFTLFYFCISTYLMIAMDAVAAFDQEKFQDLEHNLSLGMDHAEAKKRYQATYDKLIKEPRFYHTLCFMCAAKVRLL